MTRLGEYISGKWATGAMPTVRGAAASLREGTADLYLKAVGEGMIVGGSAQCSTGAMTIFPSRELFEGMDDGTQEVVLNVLDSSNFYRENGSLLLGAVYAPEVMFQEPVTMLTVPQQAEAVEPGTEGTLDLEPEAEPEPEPELEAVEEAEPEAEVELDPVLLAAEQFYRKTIPNRDGWGLNPKHPFQLPVEAYADWRMAHGDLGLGTDTLIPSHELHRVAKSLRVPGGRIKILSGDEAGRREPADPRFQAFREKGRKYFTSSTLEHLKEASKATYQRKSWIK